MPHNVWHAAAGRVLLGLIFVFVFSSFTLLLLALNHLPRLASAAGLLAAAIIKRLLLLLF